MAGASHINQHVNHTLEVALTQYAFFPRNIRRSLAIPKESCSLVFRPASSYPLVICHGAIDNGHGNSGFTQLQHDDFP